MYFALRLFDPEQSRLAAYIATLLDLSVKNAVALTLTAAVALLCGVLLIRGPSRLNETSLPASPHPAALSSNSSALSEMETPLPSTDLPRKLEQVLTALRAGRHDGAPIAGHARLLREIKSLALSEEPTTAAEAIINALAGKNDALTGLGFVVGGGGVLLEAPTFRTALLDILGQVEPFAAAAHARVAVLDPTITPDEYAVALRNLAHGPRDKFSAAEVRTAFSRMLSRRDWRNHPTSGFLEAFDTAVETSAFDEIAPLIVDPGGAPESLVSRAAFIAADRIMLKNPATVVQSFRAHPAVLASAPFHRASLLSRLDVREPEQLALLEDYLLGNHQAPGELEYFLDIFPNGNAFVGNSLITRGGVTAPDIESVARADAAALRALHRWISLPAFSTEIPRLDRVINRLEAASRPSP